MRPPAGYGRGSGAADRHVDWRLSIHPTRIEELSISARVDRIERLPGHLESAFGAP